MVSTHEMVAAHVIAMVVSFKMDIYLIYSVVLVFDAQQSDSVINICIFFSDSFPLEFIIRY